MIKYISNKEWRKLFNKYMRFYWYSTEADEHFNSIYYTVDNDVYMALDIGQEVYVEEFNTLHELQEFYRNKVNYDAGIQTTIFDF